MHTWRAMWAFQYYMFVHVCLQATPIQKIVVYSIATPIGTTQVTTPVILVPGFSVMCS